MHKERATRCSRSKPKASPPAHRGSSLKHKYHKCDWKWFIFVPESSLFLSSLSTPSYACSATFAVLRGRISPSISYPDTQLLSNCLFLVLVCMLCSLPAGFRQPCTFPWFHKHPQVIYLYLQVRIEDTWVSQINSAVHGHAICPKMYHLYSRDVFAHELKRKKRCLCIWLSAGCGCK